MNKKNYLMIFVSILSVSSILLSLTACRNTSPLENPEDGPEGVAFDSSELKEGNESTPEDKADPITTILKSADPIKTYNDYIAQNNSILVNDYIASGTAEGFVFLKKESNGELKGIIQIGTINNVAGLVDGTPNNNLVKLLFEKSVPTNIANPVFLACAVDKYLIRASYKMTKEEFDNYTNTLSSAGESIWANGPSKNGNVFSSSNQNGETLSIAFEEETGIAVITIEQPREQ